MREEKRESGVEHVKKKKNPGKGKENRDSRAGKYKV